MLKKEIGIRMAKIRRELDLTQLEFSSYFNIGRANYGRIETGEVFPNANILRTIKIKFKISLDWLITGEGEMFIKSNQTETLPDGTAFNDSIMREVIETVEYLFKKHNRSLSPEKKAELLLLLYEEIMEDESRKDLVLNRIPKLLKII